jgi:hypothetical protein
MAPKKLTAANCPQIATVKRLMNAEIFKRFSALMNAGDLDGARAFYGSFFRADVRDQKVAELFATEPAGN